MPSRSQDLLAAGVGFDDEHAALERFLHALGVALDDDERDVLLRGTRRAMTLPIRPKPQRMKWSVELVQSCGRSAAAEAAARRPPSTTIVASSVKA